MPLFQRTAKTDSLRVLNLPIGDISPNPNQPRRTFPPEELNELALSIREVGVLQPLTVRQCLWSSLPADQPSQGACSRT